MRNNTNEDSCHNNNNNNVEQQNQEQQEEEQNTSIVRKRLSKLSITRSCCIIITIICSIFIILLVSISIVFVIAPESIIGSTTDEESSSLSLSKQTPEQEQSSISFNFSQSNSSSSSSSSFSQNHTNHPSSTTIVSNVTTTTTTTAIVVVTVMPTVVPSIQSNQILINQSTTTTTTTTSSPSPSTSSTTNTTSLNLTTISSPPLIPTIASPTLTSIPTRQPTSNPIAIQLPQPVPVPLPVPIPVPVPQPIPQPVPLPVPQPVPMSMPIPVSTNTPVSIPPISNYQIELDFVNVPESDKQYFQNAINKFQRIIVDDIPDTIDTSVLGISPTIQGCTYPKSIDDLYICIGYEIIDGEYGVLGYSSVSYTQIIYNNKLQKNNYIPVIGTVVFDTNDASSLISKGTYDRVILHEIAHVLGIGGFFAVNQLINSTTSCSTYYGIEGNKMYQQLSGCTTSSTSTLPIEQDGGIGTECTHLSNTCFINEIMTGYFNREVPNPFSVLSIVTLIDI